MGRGSARFWEISGELCLRHTVLDFCVGDCTMFLTQMKSKLALVTKMEIAFFAMIGLLSSVNT